MTKIPEDFHAALTRAELADFFSECTRPHQNEYLKWIAEAKRLETRTARIAKAVNMLSAKCAEEKPRARKR